MEYEDKLIQSHHQPEEIQGHASARGKERSWIMQYDTIATQLIPFQNNLIIQQIHNNTKAYTQTKKEIEVKNLWQTLY